MTTFHILLVRRRNHTTNVPMLITAILLFSLATTQIVVDTVSVFQAFLDTPNAAARNAYFLNDSNKILTAKHAIFFHMMLLGDVIVIYRCFVVYSLNIWIVIFPILCSIGSTVITYLITWASLHPKPGAFLLENDEAWGTALFSLSLVANVYAVSLIAYRIWTVEKRQGGLKPTYSWAGGRQSLMPVARIVLESGALNAAYLITYIAILDSGSSALTVISDLASPLVGLIFSMVIIQAELRTAREHSKQSARTTDTLGSVNYSPPTGSRTDVTRAGRDVNSSTTRVGGSLMSSSAPTFEMSFFKDDSSDKKADAI